MPFARAELRMSEVICSTSPRAAAGTRRAVVSDRMRLAEGARLEAQARSDLHYALLLKDAGYSSNAAEICTLFRCEDLRLGRARRTVSGSRSSGILSTLASC
jgi:hypothetical protein